MSYCRFGEGDVYVYGSSNGFVCDSCRLVDGDFMCKTRAAMLEHLNKHVAAGDHVGSAIERLQAEIDEGGTMIEQEMNRIIAEKIMGWHWIEDYGTGHYCSVGAWLDSSDKIQYWTEPWQPTENIAQAIEAAEALRLRDSEHNDWDLTSQFIAVKHSEHDKSHLFSAGIGLDVIRVRAYANTPALAICEALVKAVSDE